jgi:DNA-binding response OmpR family regulator
MKAMASAEPHRRGGRSWRCVWGIEPGGDARRVDMHVKRLREKLGRAAIYVQTLRGLGYRFSAAE